MVVSFRGVGNEIMLFSAFDKDSLLDVDSFILVSRLVCVSKESVLATAFAIADVVACCCGCGTLFIELLEFTR